MKKCYFSSICDFTCIGSESTDCPKRANKRKFVWVLRITDPTDKTYCTSVYTEFEFAQKHMLRDIYETIVKHGLTANFTFPPDTHKVSFDDFVWEITKADLVDRIDF